MRVIVRRTLREFWQAHRRAEQPLKAWYAEAAKADWKSPQDIKDIYAHASFVADNRIVFNIAGNRYRLIAHVNYHYQIVYVKFIGTHAEYDRIDPGDSVMDIRPIKTDSDYERALTRVGELMDAKPDSLEGDELDVLATLLEAYETRQFPIEAADPVDAILFRLEQQGLDRKDLEPYLGSRQRVSEVLNRKRALSLEMIRRLHEGLRIPLENLIGRAA